MIAIAKIGGHQAIVEVGEILETDKINAEAGKKVSFETLLVSEASGEGFKIGDPVLKGLRLKRKF